MLLFSRSTCKVRSQCLCYTHGKGVLTCYLIYKEKLISQISVVNDSSLGVISVYISLVESTLAEFGSELFLGNAWYFFLKLKLLCIFLFLAQCLCYFNMKKGDPCAYLLVGTWEWCLMWLILKEIGENVSMVSIPFEQLKPLY